MKKSLNWLFVLILMVLTPIIVCYLSFQTIAFDETFYKQAFVESKVYETLSEYDIETINTEVLQYLQDDSIQQLTTTFFTENEKAHLKDVQNLISKTDQFALICIAVLVAVAIVSLLTEHHPRIILRGLLSGSVLTIVLIGLLGIISTIDFMGAFTVFHQIFFPQGNYSFNPAIEKIVVLYPPLLFFKATMSIVIRIVIATILIGITSYIFLRILKKNPTTESTAQHS